MKVSSLCPTNTNVSPSVTTRPTSSRPRSRRSRKNWSLDPARYRLAGAGALWHYQNESLVAGTAPGDIRQRGTVRQTEQAASYSLDPSGVSTALLHLQAR